MNSLPFQKEDNNTGLYIFLMSLFRTEKFPYKFYELIKYYLWGGLDTKKWYHTIYYLHDKDFLYFAINMDALESYSFKFFETLEELEAELPSSILERFRKETITE